MIVVMVYAGTSRVKWKGGGGGGGRLCVPMHACVLSENVFHWRYTNNMLEPCNSALREVKTVKLS